MKTTNYKLMCILISVLALWVGEYICAAETDAGGLGILTDKDQSPEADLRQRFLEAYEAAKTPDLRAEPVRMLKGVKEQASMRLLTGMLGDTSDAVRQAACETMAATPDPDGFFVKPLMGTLMDSSDAVRVAAAGAISRATVKADAVKALILALSTFVDRSSAAGSDMDALAAANSIHACDKALERLTGEKSKERDSRSLSAFWNHYWHLHDDDLRADDRKKIEKEPPPRPANLPPDSLDKK